MVVDSEHTAGVRLDGERRVRYVTCGGRPLKPGLFVLIGIDEQVHRGRVVIAPSQLVEYHGDVPRGRIVSLDGPTSEPPAAELSEAGRLEQLLDLPQIGRAHV